jgi:hypothetical protein
MFLRENNTMAGNKKNRQNNATATQATSDKESTGGGLEMKGVEELEGGEFGALSGGDEGSGEMVSGEGEGEDKENTPSGNGPVAPKVVDKKQVFALLEENETYKTTIETARQQIKDAEERRSRCLGMIVELSGFKKIKHKGREITIVGRKNKKTGVMTHFERGEGDPSTFLEVE